MGKESEEPKLPIIAEGVGARAEEGCPPSSEEAENFSRVVKENFHHERSRIYQIHPTIGSDEAEQSHQRRFLDIISSTSFTFSPSFFTE